MADLDHLFVIGLGRSGTTALADVLSAHPRVAMGMERYKKLWTAARIDEFTPQLFTPEGFLDFSDGLTNITPEQPRWQKYYQRAARNLQRGRYLADKETEVSVLPTVFRNFPRARFLIIVRDVHPLAWSWEQRAANPDDRGWPASRDALASVGFWNEAMRTVLGLRRAAPERVLLVEYDAFFSSAEPLNRALEHLGLDLAEPAAVKFADVNQRYLSQIREKERELPEDIRDRIEQERDGQVWDELMSELV